MPAFFVHFGASSMASRLGNFEGHAFPEALVAQVQFPEDDIVKEVWDHRLSTVLATIRVEGDHPSGFYGAILRGVFGMKKPGHADVLALQKRILMVFLENWKDVKFRSVTWGLPEMNKYRDGRVKFLLEALVQDWLGERETVSEIRSLTIELCARAFDFQIGVVRVDNKRNLGLTVFGDFSRPRVYVACNGLERHLQKFYFFKRGWYII